MAKSCRCPSTSSPLKVCVSGAELIASWNDVFVYQISNGKYKRYNMTRPQVDTSESIVSYRINHFDITVILSLKIPGS
ncbi:unnamed protein product [Dovyalis caffra]|uniref:Uncharacterized protein n=1 Tax=Dovyalis caffra TaxID=77055 RepID=A0AAV1QTD5_9ROSI|nr:unnamed protein product [Dovyalis caffra]